MQDKKTFLKKTSNKEGSSLIFSLLVLTVLIILSSGFFILAINELNIAKRYRDSTKAFWLAEAGLNQFMQDTTLLDGGDLTLTFGSDTVTLSKDDSDSVVRTVTATGIVSSSFRSNIIKYQANPPNLFSNTLSTGGNITFTGNLGQLDIYGQTRTTGIYSKSGTSLDEWFEDKQEGITSTSSTLTIPDSNENGTSDEFNDFVQFYQDIASTYLSDEVVYIQDDSTQVITPNESLEGKKIIFVEGSSSGTGDVTILFDATWADDQNLTIISTGTVDYIQPLDTSADSQLNVIAWEGYTESAILDGTHAGVVYTHGTASFDSVTEDSESVGNLIANDGITINISNDSAVKKTFLYDDPIENNIVPSGFEGLTSDAPSGYYSEPYYWGET